MEGGIEAEQDMVEGAEKLVARKTLMAELLQAKGELLQAKGELAQTKAELAQTKAELAQTKIELGAAREVVQVRTMALSMLMTTKLPLKELETEETEMLFEGGVLVVSQEQQARKRKYEEKCSRAGQVIVLRKTT